MKHTQKFALFTNDVETTSIWFNTLRDETGFKVFKEGIPRLLDIYSQFNITSTFFFTGYIAKLIPAVVKRVSEQGHEVASHGKSHLPENGFDIMPFEKQKRHLQYTKQLLEDISGKEVISFRAPALRVNDNTAKALLETGHKIDSSVASQRFDFFLSFGGLKKLKWFIAPRLPYKVNADNILEKGNSELVEIPLSALFLPYVGTTMRIFPRITSFQHSGAHLENRATGKPIVFIIHPNELIDESNEDRIIHKRSQGSINHFLKDVIRSRLKIKNLGVKGESLYKRELEYFYEKDYTFTSLKNYCELHKLI